MDFKNRESGMDMKIKLHYDREYQTFEGFGSSGAWWAQEVGGRISDYLGAARANEPTISVYSNYDALFKKPPPEEKPSVVVNKQINISNSTVVIN